MENLFYHHSMRLDKMRLDYISLSKLKIYADLVKIQHTLFALPFAYAGAFMAARGIPSVRVILLIFIAFTGLRTASMALNNLIDREIDAINPRTSDRPLPSGNISIQEVYGIIVISILAYEMAAYLINRTTFLLSPIPVITAIVYPYLKRYTSLSHYVLGLALAYAPLGGWVAVTDSFHPLSSELPPLMIALGVMFWVAGFDIIYSIQDRDFDINHSLHSIPADFGIKKGLVISALSHLFTIIFFALTLWVFPFNRVFLTGLVIISCLLVTEHWIVRPGNVEKKHIQVAFFNLNAMVSFIMLLSIFLDLIL